MADKKISALGAVVSTATTDIAHIVADMGSTPVNKKITVANLFNTIPTTIGYGTTAVGAVTVSVTTQALDGKAMFLCTGTGSAACIATMNNGDHVGQTITIVLVGTAPTSFKINLDTNSTFINKDSHPIISIPAIGDSATVMWSGTAWFGVSYVGTAATAAS